MNYFVEGIQGSGDDIIFECSLFQNIVEDMILYRNASDSERMDFSQCTFASLYNKKVLSQ